ncbi:MAG TPA: hypothetical protein VIM99_08470 [Blastocatellia bacterium]
MENETLRAMNEGFYLSLLTAIEVIILLSVVLAIAGFAIYLAGVAWFCFSEMRQPARRRTTSAAPPPEPDEHDLLVTLACLDDSAAGEAMSREQTLMQIIK